MRRCILYLALLAPSIGCAMSGNDLVQRCSSTAESYDAGFCDGYLRSIADVTRVMDEQHRRADGSGICVPPDVTLAEVRRRFLRWAAEHSRDLRYAADTQLLRALAAAYPCPSRQN